MPYVDQDKGGIVTGCFANAQYKGQHFLDEADNAMQSFRNPPPPPPTQAELKKTVVLSDPTVPQSVKDYLAAL